MMARCGTVGGLEVCRLLGTDRYYVRERAGEDRGASPVPDLHRRRPIGCFGSCEAAMRHVRAGLAR